MQSRIIEIACDESGFSGTNLLDVDGQVFTHASVRLSVESARECVETVRGRFSHPSSEYKSKQLTRNDEALAWLLGPAGPLRGNAHVHLTDKTFFVVSRLVDVLAGELRYAAMTSLDRDGRAREMSRLLYREGPRTFGPDRWQAFLEAFVAMLRVKRRPDGFSHRFPELPDAPGRIGEIVELLRRAEFRMDAIDRRMLPPLEPLIPAVVQTALYWGQVARTVAMVHDEQSALTRNRVSRINHLLDGFPILTVRLVDSRSDPRVQVADFLAGAARRIATLELRGQGDPELTALLRPYVDPHCIWADAPSWSRLA